MNAPITTFLRENADTLDRLTRFMLDYNKKVNLTRITEPCEIIEKHYIDSILPLILYDVPRGTSDNCQLSTVNCQLPVISRGTIALDVGSGAGFPGVPMKLYRPDLDVTLLDSSKKRTDYLGALLHEINVNCRVVTARSEELAHSPEHREKYGLVTARAVANLAALCEYCLPFVQVSGVFLAMKGENDEVDSASGALKLLGGEISSIKKYELPSGDKRSLIVIRKVRQTPTRYPRKRVNITKNPL